MDMRIVFNACIRTLRYVLVQTDLYGDEKSFLKSKVLIEVLDQTSEIFRLNGCAK